MPTFHFQMTAKHLFQGSGIASLSARFFAPECKRKFLILDQKIFLLIAIENILQRLPLLLYDEEMWVTENLECYCVLAHPYSATICMHNAVALCVKRKKQFGNWMACC